jgi:hypothetical protein
LKTADEMIEHVRAQRGLDELAANPLLLSSMCIIYDEGKRLPQDKYELYDRIVDTVLHKRYPPVKERVSVIRGRLGAVALGLHTGGGADGSRASPEPVGSDAEIDEYLKAYRRQDGATEQGWTNMVESLEDMVGNVFEWCADFYDPKISPGFRVLHGGCWGDYSGYCRAADRSRSTPEYRNDDVGCRVLCCCSSGLK